MSRSPFGNVNTTAAVAESFAVVVGGCSVVSHASTSRIAICGFVTIGIREKAGLSRTSNGTVGTRVHGYGVRLASVYTFDDICTLSVEQRNMNAFLPTYFAIGRPFWSKEPKSWPSSTAIWHVAQIQDEEAVSVCVITDKPNGWPPWSTIRPYVRCVHTDGNTVLVRSRVAICNRNGFVHVSEDVSEGHVRYKTDRTH